MTSVLTLIIRALKEPSQTEWRRKVLNTGGTVSLEKTIAMTWQRRKWSQARSLSRAIKELIGLPQILGHNKESRYFQDVIDEITMVLWNAQLLKSHEEGNSNSCTFDNRQKFSIFLDQKKLCEKRQQALWEIQSIPFPPAPPPKWTYSATHLEG